MKKQEALKLWHDLPANQNILRVMTPVAYKATGSRYGACGIRIDGNPQFVRAVMSRLKDLIAGENHETRLGLAWNVVDGSGIGKVLDNADTGAECCYVRLCERGNEGKMASAFFDRHLNSAQAEFDTAISA